MGLRLGMWLWLVVRAALHRLLGSGVVRLVLVVRLRVRLVRLVVRIALLLVVVVRALRTPLLAHVFL